MRWTDKLVGMALVQAGMIYILCLRNHFPMIWIAKGTLYLLPVNVGLLVLIEWMAKGPLGVFYRFGGSASQGVSYERGLAFNGEREEACRLLLKRAKHDSLALRTLVEIAGEKPVLYDYVVKASGVVAKSRHLSPQQRKALISTLSRSTSRSLNKKPEPQIAPDGSARSAADRMDAYLDSIR